VQALSSSPSTEKKKELDLENKIVNPIKTLKMTTNTVLGTY
jgi:hypothetical protein